MNLTDFVEALEKAASKYMIRLRILVKTDNAVKARIEISDNIYVQFYYHQISGTSNYVLVGWDRRLYGRDSVGGKWHKHPFENPQEHDFTEDGAKDVDPEEFLDEVFEILLHEELI
jgi:hypothetical protein